MLKTKGLRFLLHIIMLVILVLLFMLCGEFLNFTSIGLLYTLLPIFVIWTIHQIRWDMLSMNANSGANALYIFLGIIMIIVSIIFGFLGMMLYFSNVANVENFDIFALSALISPFITFIFALLSQGDDWNEKIAPFMSLILTGISVVGGILITAIDPTRVVGGIILLIAGIITIIILIKEEYFELSSGLSGLGSSSSSSSSYVPKSSYGSSGRGSARGEMEYIANGHSVYSHYIDCGAYLYPNVSVSFNYGTVTFTINGKIVLESGRDYDSNEISNINFYTDRKLSELANEILSDAQRKISELSSNGVDCSDARSIQVRVGNVYTDR